jgi:tRNA threonylcarbamoyl adenosine modification protein (Sua5/YciO/YrdC/YwlC family)
MDKKPDLPPELSTYPTIGIRMPNLNFTLRLLCAVGPLATTSANISDQVNTTTAEAVFSQLNNRVDLILDGGQTPGMTPSTVLEVSQASLLILRSGPISLEEIQAVLESNNIKP